MAILHFRTLFLYISLQVCPVIISGLAETTLEITEQFQAAIIKGIQIRKERWRYSLLLPLHPYNSQAATYGMEVQQKFLSSNFTVYSSAGAVPACVVIHESNKRHQRNHHIDANAEARNLFSALAIAGNTIWTQVV